MNLRGRPRPPRPFLDRFLPAGLPEDFEAYLAVILRDLEELLNSRPGFEPAAEERPTVLDYGLGDLSAAGRSPEELWRLSLAVKKSLEVFEPRLCRVRVEPVDQPPAAFNQARLRVTASLTGFETREPLDLELPLGNL